MYEEFRDVAGRVAAVGLVLWAGASYVQDYQDKRDISARIDEDTQRVSTAMQQLAAKPVELFAHPYTCLTAAEPNRCKELFDAAKRNAGDATFMMGVYYNKNYKHDTKATFQACAHDHGWNACKTDSYGDTYVEVVPQIIAPPGNPAQAQFVWMLPGYKSVHMAMATDGRKYPLTLK